MKVFCTLTLVCLVTILAAPVYASDFSFGSTARSVAMGGAGLALTDNAGTNVVLNPAAPAASGQGVRFIFPGLEFHTTGASFDDLSDSVDKISSGDTNDALDLVNDFAKQQTTLSFSTVTGFAGPFGVTVAANAQGIISPGTAAAEWANAAQLFRDKTGLDLTELQTTITNANFQETITKAQAGDIAGANTAFDAYLTDLSQNFVDGNFVYGPGISLSKGFTTKSGGRLWLGTNISFLRGEAHRWQITATSPSGVSVSGTTVTADVDFEAVEQPVIKKTTTKADVGLIYRPNNSMLQYGVVIENLIEPKLDGFPNRKNERSLGVGLAMMPAKNIIWAVDFVNINGANDEDAQLRMGGEVRLGRFMALRAGYSGSKWTYGLGIFGINFAWAGKSAQLLSNVLKF